MDDENIICVKKEAGERIVAAFQQHKEAGTASTDLLFLYELLEPELQNIHVYSRRYLDKCDNGEGNPIGDRSIWQFLPYMPITYDNNPLLYRRTKKVGEARLAGNTSIGIGGHPSVCPVEYPEVYVGLDKPAFSSLNELIHHLASNIQRELEEEVTFRDTLQPERVKLEDHFVDVEFKGFIVDHSNEVGQLHLGIHIDAEAVFPMICKEEELETIGHLPVEQIKAYDNNENWTKIILESL